MNYNDRSPRDDSIRRPSTDGARKFTADSTRRPSTDSTRRAYTKSYREQGAPNRGTSAPRRSYSPSGDRRPSGDRDRNRSSGGRPSFNSNRRSGGFRSGGGNRPMGRSNNNLHMEPTTSPSTLSFPKAEKDVVRILIVGGVDQIGKNLYAVEYNDEIILMDCGFTFSNPSTPGVSCILPNIKYLEERKDKIKAILVSHGHLDHIGAIPFLMDSLNNPPIYSRDLTLAIIKNRQLEFPNQKPLDLRPIEKDTAIQVGNITARFFGVTHTIPESMGIILETKNGDVVFTGDIKLTHEDQVVSETDKKEFEIFKKRKVLMTLCDSTNIEREGFSVPESRVIKTVDEIIRKANGRVIIGSFASQIDRNVKFIDNVVKAGKFVVAQGRSMVTNLTIAIDLGLLKIDKHALLPIEKANEYPKNKIVIFATGSQGEEYSALERMASKTHKFVKVDKDDTIVFSSSVIAGNERNVQTIKNNLSKQGANLITYETNDGVHASGHGNKGELKWVHEHIKTKFFIPVHGYHYMLTQHKKLLLELGLPEKNIVVPEEGNIIDISADGESIQLLEHKMPSTEVVVDGNKIGEINDVVMNDRKTLATDGFMIAQVLVRKGSGAITRTPDIITRGLVYIKESQDLMDQARMVIKKAAEGEISDGRSVNIQDMKKRISKDLGSFVFNQTGKKPIITSNIIII